MSKRRTKRATVTRQQEKRILKKDFKPITIHQRDYVMDIAENVVTFATGPSGTGKTAVAVGLACEYLAMDKVKKIIITRPTVETSDKGLGFLPGDMREKINPYLMPILEEMYKYFGEKETELMLHDGKIEISPLEFMRGRNFDDAFVLLDEGQNCTYQQIKMFLTRLGKTSKAIITGDIDQVDIRGRSGLEVWTELLEEVDDVAIVRLTHQDIVRNKIVASILKKAEEFEKNRRNHLDKKVY